MKSIIAICFIFILNSVTLFTCDDCTAAQYQIYQIDPTTTGLCLYKTRAMGNCPVWRHQGHKDFTDSCGKYVMSHFFLKTWLDANYP